MEAFNFFKLWKISSVAGNVIPPPEYDDEDAFFDLELNYESKHLSSLAKVTQVNNNSESDEEYEFLENSPKSAGGPRSPISFLRSPPKLSVFFKLRKTKMSVSGDESPAPGTPVLSQSNSRKARGPNGVVRKYLRLMKIRISSEKLVSGEFVPESPSNKIVGDRKGVRSPSMRIVCRRSEKSRFALPSNGVVSVGSPGSDLVVQSDGIQSAILHCKRSYNSSRDLTVLSRSVSEPVITANPSRFSIEEMRRITI